MLTALEAREQTLREKKRKIDLLLNKINEEIEIAIKKGENDIFLSEYINDDLKDIMLKYGYKIERFDNQLDTWTKISW